MEAHESAAKEEARRTGLKTPPLIGAASDPRRSPAMGRLVTTRSALDLATSLASAEYVASSRSDWDTGSLFPEDPATVLAALSAERQAGGPGGTTSPIRGSSLPLAGQRLLANQLSSKERAMLAKEMSLGVPNPRTAVDLQVEW